MLKDVLEMLGKLLVWWLVAFFIFAFAIMQCSQKVNANITITDVNDTPNIHAISDVTIDEDTTTTVVLTISDVDSYLTTASLSYNSANTDLINNTAGAPNLRSSPSC